MYTQKKENHTVNYQFPRETHVYLFYYGWEPLLVGKAIQRIPKSLEIASTVP